MHTRGLFFVKTGGDSRQSVLLLVLTTAVSKCSVPQLQSVWTLERLLISLGTKPRTKPGLPGLAQF